MREDATKFTPFTDHFKLEVVKTIRRSGANTEERSLVAKYDSTGASGYNKLKGSPTSSRQWWAMIRGKQAKQA